MSTAVGDTDKGLAKRLLLYAVNKSPRHEMLWVDLWQRLEETAMARLALKSTA